MSQIKKAVEPTQKEIDAWTEIKVRQQIPLLIEWIRTKRPNVYRQLLYDCFSTHRRNETDLTMWIRRHIVEFAEHHGIITPERAAANV